jgi:hypothetical protein
MPKIKTFTTDLRIFKTAAQLQALDEVVNAFIAEGGIQKVYSVSDTTTTDENGATMGLVRVLAYD